MVQCSHPVWDRDWKKLCHSSFSSTNAKCVGRPASHMPEAPPNKMEPDISEGRQILTDRSILDKEMGIGEVNIYV